jgi:hypothetical protein
VSEQRILNSRSRNSNCNLDLLTGDTIALDTMSFTCPISIDDGEDEVVNLWDDQLELIDYGNFKTHFAQLQLPGLTVSRF